MLSLSVSILLAPAIWFGVVPHSTEPFRFLFHLEEQSWKIFNLPELLLYLKLKLERNPITHEKIDNTVSMSREVVALKSSVF